METQTIKISVTLSSEGVAQGTAKAKRTLDQFGNSVQTHQRRLETLTQKHNNSLELLERRKQAQIEVIRERAFQREVDRLRKLENHSRQSALAVSRSFATLGGIGIGAGLIAGGKSAFDSAKEIDKVRSSIAAMTGSVGQANAKLAEL